MAVLEEWSHAHRSLLLHGAVSSIGSTAREFVPTSLWSDLSPCEWLVRQMEENIYMQTATWLVSREVTEAAGPWDTRLLGDDDGEYFSRVLLRERWHAVCAGGEGLLSDGWIQQPELHRNF